MNRDIRAGLAWCGGMIGVALAATGAMRLGYIDHDTVTRLVMATIGLMVAWSGNRAPKAFAPSGRCRQVNRIAGWSVALSGLVYIALWVFAPIPVATAGGCAAILAGLAVTFGYCLSLRRKGTAA